MSTRCCHDFIAFFNFTRRQKAVLGAGGCLPDRVPRAGQVAAGCRPSPGPRPAPTPGAGTVPHSGVSPEPPLLPARLQQVPECFSPHERIGARVNG